MSNIRQIPWNYSAAHDSKYWIHITVWPCALIQYIKPFSIYIKPFSFDINPFSFYIKTFSFDINPFSFFIKTFSFDIKPFSFKIKAQISESVVKREMTICWGRWPRFKQLQCVATSSLVTHSKTCFNMISEVWTKYSDEFVFQCKVWGWLWRWKW